MKKSFNLFGLSVLSLLPTNVLAYSTPDVTIKDPSTTNIATIIGNIIDWVLIFAGSLAILFVIWGGLQYILAAGNDKGIETAKKTLTNSILGLVIVIVARLIVSLVQNAVGAFI